MTSTSKKTLKLVKELIASGLGRKRIADTLDCTEYRAGLLMEEAVKTVKKKKPIKRITSGTPFRKETTNCGKKPTITVSPEAKQKSSPNRIVVRPASLRVAVISDVHYPFEDASAIKVCKAYLQDYDPDLIVFNGDMLDFYSVSKYEKDPKRKLDLQQEIDYGVEKLEGWCDDFPGTEMVYIEGNHETRMARFLKSNAKALMSMRTLDVKKNLDLAALGIQWIDAHMEYQVGNLLFTHGEKARKHAGSSARGQFEDFGCSVIIGHIHRLSVAYKRNKGGNHALIENGTLCDLDVEYCRFPDWQHGFTTIDFDGDDFTPHVHPIHDYKLIAGDKVYEL